MNAERLLQHYEQIADAPDAIARLRRFILDLAVRGKLVPQDSADEPASELLKRIAEEKARPGSKRDPGGPVGNMPKFAVPNGWAWTTLGGVSTVTMGQSPPGDTYNTSGDGVPLINGPVEFTAGPFGQTVVNQYTTAPTNFCEEGDLLICVRGSTTGRTNIAAFRACIGRGVAAIHSSFDDSFVRLFIWKARYDIIEMGRGIAFPSVSKKQIEDLAFPLPPLAEQHRIVAKVEELMAFCDELEAARTERETKRDRLAAASLARLNAPDPETFREDARFALDALPALTARPDQIKQLRQTILNLAVRGKLVPQDPADEPAEELLKRIAGKKTDKIRRAELRRNGLPDASLRREEELEPHNWIWTQLGEVALSMRYGTSVKCDYGTKGAPVLRIPNVSGGRVSLDDIKFGPLSPSEIQDLSLLEGDILLIRSNGSLEIVGRAAVVTPDAVGMSFAGYLVRLRTDPTEIDPAYIWIALQSSEVRDQIEQPIRSAVGLKNVNLTEFGALTFRLPPLAEQHRIVAKVDELMALCDQLETSLVRAEETRGKLLDALLAEALAPVAAEALQEAAE